MANTALTPAIEFCNYHHIEYAFVESLHEAGLVELMVINETKFIPHSGMLALERMIRLHQDLDINVAGIEAITHLLQRVEDMQHQLINLRNRLKSYE